MSECFVADLFNAVRNNDDVKIFAAIKSFVSDGSDTVRDDNGSKVSTFIKCASADGNGALRDDIFRIVFGWRIPNQTFVLFTEEDAVNDFQSRMIRRNNDVCQIVTTLKRIVLDGSNAVRDDDGGKAFTIGKRTFPNRGGTLGNSVF